MHEMPPGWEASAREIARRARVSHPTALRVLSTLADQRVVDLTKTPSADRYRLNEQHVSFRPLIEVFAWEEQLMGALIALLAETIPVALPEAQAAYVFGSTARGEEDIGSDLDLAIIVPGADTADVEEKLEPVVDEVGRRFGIWMHVIIGREPLHVLTRPRARGRILWDTIQRRGIPVLDSVA